MSTVEQSNTSCARRWFEEVWNQGREGTIDEMCAADAVIHGLGQDGQDLVGPQHFRRFYHQFKAGLPDIRITVDDVIAAGDQTAVRVTCRATHAGDGLGVPPTGRRVECTGIVWMRWRDGRVAEAWNEFDAAGLVAQIAGPGPATVKAR
jgi:steroid delta-isomerase-like uncharacterized protein